MTRRARDLVKRLEVEGAEDVGGQQRRWIDADGSSGLQPC